MELSPLSIVPDISPALPLFPRGSRTGENTFFFGSISAPRFASGDDVFAISFIDVGRRRAGVAPEPTRAMRARAGEGAALGTGLEAWA
jgi:hypothetical protein